MSELSKKKCIACQTGTPPIKEEALKKYLQELEGGWKLIEEHHIEKEYTFPNFQKALDFVNKVGKVAEKQGHHPDVFLSWGKVRLTFWTHKIQGLSESDFIMAAKSDSIYELF